MQSRFVFVSLEFSSNIFSCLSLSRYVLLEESQRHREIVLFTFTFFFLLSSFNDRLTRLKGKDWENIAISGRGARVSFRSNESEFVKSMDDKFGSGDIFTARNLATPLYFGPLSESSFPFLGLRICTSPLFPPFDRSSSSAFPRAALSREDEVERGGWRTTIILGRKVRMRFIFGQRAL